jgi:hypothetical protein
MSDNRDGNLASKTTTSPPKRTMMKWGWNAPAEFAEAPVPNQPKPKGTVAPTKNAHLAPPLADGVSPPAVFNGALHLNVDRVVLKTDNLNADKDPKGCYGCHARPNSKGAHFCHNCFWLLLDPFTGRSCFCGSVFAMQRKAHLKQRERGSQAGYPHFAAEQRVLDELFNKWGPTFSTVLRASANWFSESDQHDHAGSYAAALAGIEEAAQGATEAMLAAYEAQPATDTAIKPDPAIESAFAEIARLTEELAQYAHWADELRAQNKELREECAERVDKLESDANESIKNANTVIHDIQRDKNTLFRENRALKEAAAKDQERIADLEDMLRDAREDFVKAAERPVKEEPRCIETRASKKRASEAASKTPQSAPKTPGTPAAAASGNQAAQRTPPAHVKHEAAEATPQPETPEQLHREGKRLASMGSRARKQAESAERGTKRERELEEKALGYEVRSAAVFKKRWDLTAKEKATALWAKATNVDEESADEE